MIIDPHTKLQVDIVHHITFQFHNITEFQFTAFCRSPGSSVG